MEDNREQYKDPGPDAPGKMPAAGTGNASNPSPRDEMEPFSDNQLIDERGEKYLREVASIEDYPDAEDEQGIDEAIKNKDQED